MKRCLRQLATVLVLWCVVCTVLAAQEAQIYPNAGHYISSSAWSPDGKIIATLGGQEIKIWNVDSGRLLRSLAVDVYLSKIAFSPDGKYIAGAHSGGIGIWDFNTGKKLITIQERGNYHYPIAFSSDSRRFAGASPNNTASVWDANTGAKLLTLSGHTGDINSIAFSPNGQRLLTGSGDRTARIWDAGTGALLHVLSGHSRNVEQAVFSPDGRFILSRSSSEIKTWNAETAQGLNTFSMNTGYALYSSGGDQLIVFARPKIVILDALSGTEQRSFPVDSYDDLLLSPDGKLCAQRSGSRGLLLYNLDTGIEIASLGSITITGIAAAALNARTFQFAVGDDDSIRIWDTRIGHLARRLTMAESSTMTSIDFSPDGKRIIQGVYVAGIKIWDAETGAELRSISKAAFDVNGASYSPNGKWFLSKASTESSEGLVLWDAESGQELRTLSTADGVSAAAISPDGKRISSYEGSIRIQDSESGREAAVIRLGERTYTSDLTYSPDSRRLACGIVTYSDASYRNYQSRVAVYDAANGRELWSLEGRTGRIQSLAYSSDGKRIVAGSDNGTITIIDADSGRELLSITGYRESISLVRFSSGGARIYSASGDGTARVWDSNSGREIARLMSFNDDAWICLTPDGYYTASQNADDHLNIVVNGEVRSMAEFRSTYNRPDIVAERLRE
jgi:WD40 repeat protein